jgi:hypothetical protein
VAISGVAAAAQIVLANRVFTPPNELPKHPAEPADADDIEEGASHLAPPADDPVDEGALLRTIFPSLVPLPDPPASSFGPRSMLTQV